MNVFVSHARKDYELARRLGERLTPNGFTVQISEDQITPGENWAKQIADALDKSEMMVILLTPRALESDSLRHNIEFALGSEKYAGRVYTVFVGPELKTSKDVPWILLKLPHRQVQSAKDFGEVAEEIRALCVEPDVSHANA